MQPSHGVVCGSCDQNLSMPFRPSSQKVTRLAQTDRIAPKAKRGADGMARAFLISD